MKLDHKALILLTLVNFFGNVIFFLMIALLVLAPNLMQNQTAQFTFLFIVGILYYFVLLMFTSHYTPVIKDWASKNKDLFVSLSWFSIYGLTFAFFYFIIDESIALEIFGAGVALYLLDKGVASFRIWKKG